MPGMSDLHTRLAAAVERSGRSARQISVAANMSPGGIGDILRKRSSPSVDNLRNIAQALNVSFSWLAEGAEEPRGGFAESDAAPWAAPAISGERPDTTAGWRAIVRALAPQARHPTTMQMQADAVAFGLLRGDVLIVDANAGEPPNGAIVVANVADLTTGTATTVVRRLLKPYLVSADPTENDTPLIADGARTAIMGPVVASFRPASNRNR